MNKKRIVASGMVIIMMAVLMTGCVRREEPQRAATLEPVRLVYYRMFDDEDVIRPLIQQYQSANSNVQITYRKFTNLEEYENLIVNELAEGEGPDIFSAPNYWILPNKKKLSPAPPDKVSPDVFRSVFVSVAANDAIFYDSADGVEKVYGIPMMVDTLALYYNRSAYEDKIPARGKPPVTWDELQDDVFLLTKRDQSFERFEQAGIAMGRSDNIARATDVLLLLMIQYGVNFYNENMSKAEFSRQRAVGATGVGASPAVEALTLYTSFALPAHKNYSWNQYISDASSASKELEAFARGKVVMIFGYSYLYDQIASKIKELEGKGERTVNLSDVRIAPAPQVHDPATSTQKRDAYANYFVETVSRTTDHPDEAWDFLVFIGSKENLEYYNEKTRRPTSRRDMLEDQKRDPIYGVFAEQTGYAESLPVYDYRKYSAILGAAVDSVLATVSVGDAIRGAEEEINAILPAGGMTTPRPAGN